MKKRIWYKNITRIVALSIILLAASLWQLRPLLAKAASNITLPPLETVGGESGGTSTPANTSTLVNASTSVSSSAAENTGETTQNLVPAATYNLFDQAGLLNESQKNELLTTGEQIIAKHPDISIALITTNNAGGKDSQTYGDDFFETHELGYGPNFDGFYVLIDMDNRNYHIGTFGQMIGILSDNRINDVLDLMQPEMESGNYGAAFAAALRSIGDFIDSGIAPENLPDTGRQGVGALGYTVAAGGFGLTTIATALGYKRKVKKDYDKFADRPSYDSGREATADYAVISDTIIDRNVAVAFVPLVRNNPSNRSSGGGGGYGGSSTHSTGGGRSAGGGGRGF